MSILIDKTTHVICQGFTGKNGTFHSEQAIAYGTQMVGGASPAKAVDPTSTCRCSTPSPRRWPTPGRRHRDLRAAAVRRRRDLEAMHAEIPLIVCITEGIPVADMVQGEAHLCGRSPA